MKAWAKFGNVWAYLFAGSVVLGEVYVIAEDYFRGMDALEQQDLGRFHTPLEARGAVEEAVARSPLFLD